MPSITIGTTVIQFPDSAKSPNWAEPVIQFAQAVEDALSSVVGPYDIGQRVMDLDGANTSVLDVTDNIKPLQFPTMVFPGSGVRGAFVRYTIFKDGSIEQGNLLCVFDGSTWSITRDYIGNLGVGVATFTIAVNGQVKVRFTTNTTQGRLTYTAQSLIQS